MLSLISVSVFYSVLLQIVAWTSPGEMKTPTRLLTQQSWKLVAVGLDVNSNNHIDEEENQRQYCQEDDLISFFPDGRGRYQENTISCDGIGEYHFNWRFVRGTSRIVWQYHSLVILRLSEEVLVLYREGYSERGEPLRYLMTYRH